MGVDGGVFLKPVFEVFAIDFVIRPHGRPAFLGRGSFPNLNHLLDWRLLLWQEGRDTLAFGGIHPDFMQAKTPFTTFFRADGLSSTVLGIVEAATYCDFALIDAQARIVDNLVWTFVQRELVTRKAMLSGGMVG